MPLKAHSPVKTISMITIEAPERFIKSPARLTSGRRQTHTQDHG
jgi:hypothetical protein